MGEVREENERLKLMLEKIEKDYKSLQLRFFNILKQESSRKSESSAPNSHDFEDEEPELVSLCLGRNPKEAKKEEKITARDFNKAKEDGGDHLKASLTLGLDSKSQLSGELSPENSSEEPKEEEAGEIWPPSKIQKTMKSGDDEAAQQNHVKRARVCVRARCDAPTVSI